MSRVSSILFFYVFFLIGEARDGKVSLLSVVLAVVLPNVVFILLSCAPSVRSLSRELYHQSMLNFVKSFFLKETIEMIFTLQLGNVAYHNA